MKARRRLIGCLFSLIFFLLLAEGGLRWLDPLGIHKLLTDQAIAGEGGFYIERRIYAYEPREYHFSDWDMTILDDLSRRVPDTNTSADCTLVFLGDSVTQSWGVSDSETWANLIARQLPDVHVINTGVSGYNSHSILAVKDEFEADAYVYLVVNNDPYGDYSSIMAGTSALGHYLIYFYERGREYPYDWSRFYRDLNVLIADPRLTLVAFDEDFGRDLSERYDVQLIEHYGDDHAISWADGHANAVGNRKIADAIWPVVQNVVRQHCP